jgi:hypothetical protein
LSSGDRARGRSRQVARFCARTHTGSTPYDHVKKGSHTHITALLCSSPCAFARPRPRRRRGWQPAALSSRLSAPERTEQGPSSNKSGASASARHTAACVFICVCMSARASLGWNASPLTFRGRAGAALDCAPRPPMRGRRPRRRLDSPAGRPQLQPAEPPRSDRSTWLPRLATAAAITALSLPGPAPAVRVRGA